MAGGVYGTCDLKLWVSDVRHRELKKEREGKQRRKGVRNDRHSLGLHAVVNMRYYNNNNIMGGLRSPIHRVHVAAAGSHYLSSNNGY